MRFRWFVLGVFVLSGALNYLDRQLLPALEPAFRADFHFSNAAYGAVLAAFSLTYAAAAPFAGLFIDRVGLNRGISAAVALWSVAGMATGLVRNITELAGCRAVLGIAQAGGVPASGKAIVTYLKPDERALGNALSQIGLGIGAMLAPLVGIGLAGRYGWRGAFFILGAAGLLWIPLWNRVARAAPPVKPAPARAAASLLRERRLWVFVLANVLSMMVYTLWSNWTTPYLAQVHRLTLAQTAGYAAVPPIFFNLGGLLGGWLSLQWMRRGAPALAARYRACLLSAAAMLATAAVPLLPTPGLATAGIAFSAFWASAMSVNLYTMPLDAFGAPQAAFAVSLLTAAYGAMQAVFSPAAGVLIDHYGFAPLCAIVAVLPLAACRLLKSATGAAPAPRRRAA
jgi:ACS family hexuronate transporter-like MFS transporter